MSATAYRPAADALRIISILAVILIHTTTKTFEITRLDIVNTPLTLILNQLARFCVPLFFMISGLVLELTYDRHISYWQYLKKRFNRIFIPYVFWSLIYVTFIYPQTNPDYLNILLYGSASHQLYFIPAILIFYLIFPLFHYLYRFLARWWVLIILGIGQLILLTWEYHYQNLRFIFPIGIALYNYFVFILGMIAAKNHQRILDFVKKYQMVLSLTLVVLASLIVWQGRSLYLQTGNYIFIYHNWRPLVLPYTILFGLLGYFWFDRIHWEKYLKTLSGLSFFVFFSHLIILEKLWQIKPGCPDLWLFLATAGLSFLMAFISRKIPHLNKLTG